jgi:hypothetical protein
VPSGEEETGEQFDHRSEAGVASVFAMKAR